MILDIHTHTFPDAIAPATIAKLRELGGTRPFTDGTLSGLSHSMKQGGIDCSVVLPVATSPRQVVRVNDASARINEQTARTGILSLGCMHPDFEDYRGELRRIRALGFRGIKIHPAYQAVDFDDVRYMRILDEASALGLAVVAHAGIDIGLPEHNWCTPDQILRVLKQVGPDKLVLAHMGGWRMWDEVEDKLAGAPVWMDTAYAVGSIHPIPGRDMDTRLMSQEQFVRLARAHGTGRILFGTDSPWGDQGEGVAEFEGLPLTRAEKDAILGGNARKLLGMDTEGGTDHA